MSHNSWDVALCSTLVHWYESYKTPYGIHVCISLLAIDIDFKGGSINGNIPKLGYLHTKAHLISEFRPQTKLESQKCLLGCSKKVSLFKKNCCLWPGHFIDYFDFKRQNAEFFFSTKGHLILKCLFDVFNSKNKYTRSSVNASSLSAKFN